MFPEVFRPDEGVARSPKLENRNFARPSGAVRNEAAVVDGAAAPSLTW
jgi:hypothetical protein